MAYQLVTVPATRRVLKKLPRNVRKHLINKVQILVENPHYGEQLEGHWRFLRALHTRYKGTDYRVVYEVDNTTKQIIIRFTASRENFYRRLREMKLKPLTTAANIF